MADHDVPAAVTAAAEAAKAGFDLARDFGGFMREVSGSAPEDAGVLVGEWLKYKRIDDAISYIAKLNHKCRRLGVDPQLLEGPSPSIMIPMLEAASMEERDELVEL